MFKFFLIKIFVCVVIVKTTSQVDFKVNYPNDSEAEECVQVIRNSKIPDLNETLEIYNFHSEFTSCLAIDYTASNSTNVSSTRKFCLLTVVRKTANKIQSQDIKRMFPIASACLPLNCAENELEKTTEFEINFCQTSDENGKFENRFGFILAESILFTVIATSFVGTFLHYISRLNCCSNLFLHKNVIFKCLRECFNLRNNFKSLFTINKRKCVGKYDLRYLNGINVLLIWITVIVHCAYFLNVSVLSKVDMFSNTKLFYRELDELSFVHNIIEKYYINMGWFFGVSGFIVTYTQLSSKATLPSFASYALNRWLRLIPSIITTIFLTILSQKFGSGPLFHAELTDVYVKPCYEKWWTHLLMINNFWTWDQMCGINLWYSAANFQLCLILYPILWLCNHKSYSLAYITSGLLACFSLIFPVFAYFDIAGIPRYDSGVRPEYSIPFESFRYFYTSPLIYLFPFFLGAITAIYMFNTNHRKISLVSSDSILLVLIILSFSIAFWPISTKFKTDENVQKNLYYIWISLFHYSAFNLMLFCIILVASNSAKSFIRKAFSLNVWQVLSKLSYGIYLSNLILIWNNVHRNDQIQTLTSSYIFQMLGLIYAESLLMAVLLFVFVELPFKNLCIFVTKPNKIFYAKQGGIEELRSNNYTNGDTKC